MRYILISLGVVLLIIFGIVIFNSGGSKTVKTPAKAVKLLDYATNNNASVQYTSEGPIDAIEFHRSVEITVGSTSRNVTVYAGYQHQALGMQTYPNDNQSYHAFLSALNQAGFTKERKVANGIAVESVCPTANRSHYKLIDAGKDVLDRWSATCSPGSYGGSLSLTSTLFKNQIPNYDDVVIDLNGRINDVAF